jgi:SAM-dependent methyltransferase
MNEMYSKHAKDYAKAIEDNIYNTLYDRPSLLALLKDEKFENCLDMGCGPGAYIPELQKFCKKITAIDLSDEFVGMVSKKYPEVNSYVANISDGLGLEEDSSFDLVISPLTIHYVEDFEKLFKEVNRVLRPNGVFAFSTHHPVVDFRDSISGNYFEREYLTQEWNTLGDTKTKVSFYRRSLSETMNALFKAGFVVEGFSEGSPSQKIKEISEERYERLSTKPQFIFIRARI